MKSIDYEPLSWDDGPGGDEKTGNNEDEDLDELFADEQTTNKPDIIDKPLERPKVDDSKTLDPLICEPCDGSRIPRTVTSPIRPSAEDVDKHYMTRRPYRNWCPVCVKARGREDAHRRATDVDEDDRTGLPIVSMDYQELNETSEKPQRIIIGKDEVTGNGFAHYVAAKGLVDDWIPRRIVRDLE